MPDPTSPEPSRGRSPAWWAVLGVTAGMTAACVWYAVRFGSNAPVMDEWDIAPHFSEQAAEGRWAEWVLLRHNEHSYVTARAVYAAVMAASGFHFQSGMVTSALLLGMAAWVFAAAARRARGRAAWADVVIPALLLHFGHGFNLLMGYQVAFTLFVLSAAVFTWLVVADRATRTWDVAVGVTLLWLLTGGGMGLAFGPPAVAWVLVRAWGRWRAGESLGWLAVAAGGPVALATAYAAWVVTGVQRASPPATGSLETYAVATGQFLAMGVGLWDVYSPWVAATVAAGSAYVVVAGWLAVVAVRSVAAERVRVLGLLAALAGVALMGVAVAWGRGGGLVDRYVTPSAVGACVVAVAAAQYGPALPRWLTDTLGVAAAVAVVAFNCGPGLTFGAAQRTYYRELEAGIKDGETPRFAAGQFAGVLFAHERFADRLDLLRRRQLGILRNMAPDGPVTTLPAVPLGPPVLPYCDTPDLVGPNPPAVPYATPGRRVLGLRVDLELDYDPLWLQLRLKWTDADGRGRIAVAYPRFRAGRQTIVFWVNDDPKDVRLTPGCATHGVTIHHAEWLAPAGP